MSLPLSAKIDQLLSWRDGRGDPPALQNPPGLSALAYRIGRYDSWLEWMTHALMEWDHYPLTTLPSEVESGSTFMSRNAVPASLRRRVRLNLSEEDNWILGLLKAWSTVGDVLTFYQERLINEGYLRTAQQPQSVHELVRLLDYRPEPAVGGSVALAVEVTDVEGLPPRVTVASGTAVASVPPPGAAPQTFELTTELEGYAAWNLLRPSLLDEEVPDVLNGTSTGLSLLGTGLALDPGSGVVISGRCQDEEVALFRLLDQIDAVNADPAHTKISWQPPLGDKYSEVVKPKVSVLRQQAHLFGDRAPSWSEQPLDLRRRFRSPRGGVQHLAPPKPWTSQNEGLPESEIRCLTYDGAGHLFCGTVDDGVWFLAADGDRWEQGEGVPAQLEVHALAVDPTGGVLAGTMRGGIYRSADHGAHWSELTGRTMGRARWTLVQRSQRLDRLPEVPVRALLTVGEGEGWSLLVGTDSGVYLSTDLANSWVPRNGGFPGSDAKTGETSLVITSLVGNGERELYAGTANGVFHSTDLGRRWQPVNRGLPGTDPLTGIGSERIRALAWRRDRRSGDNVLLAGTSQGVYRSQDGGTSWQSAREGMRGPDDKSVPQVDSLVVVDDPITVTTRCVAGAEAGLWESADLGDSWRRIELEVPEITAVAAGPRASLATASPLAGFSVEEWPGFELSHHHIDLDRLGPAPASGSWVVLAPDPGLEDPPPAGVFRVKRTFPTERCDFTLDATVTRIELEGRPELRPYPLRRTRVYFQSQELALLPKLQRASFSKVLSEMESILKSIESDRSLIVTTESSGPDSGEEGDAVEPGETAEGADVASQQVEADVVEELAGQESVVRDGSSGQQGVQTTAGELASELRYILSQDAPGSDGGPSTGVGGLLGRLRLSVSSLDSFSVYGNVATATEGRTLRDEVLGDGDASKVLQRFQLSEPLAYQRGAPKSLASLSVRVNDQLWREVPCLYGEAPDARVYEIERAHDGRATVIFGDGTYGSRLPTGRGNVVATYQTGITDGDIFPNSVRLMSSRPLGLANVGNPLAGTPGSLIEPPDSIRQRAPRSLRVFGRILSVRDYEDFALGFPGISKATAQELDLEGRRIIHLTVATQGRHHRPAAGSRLLDDLLTAIEKIRSGSQVIRIEPFRHAPLEVAAEVRLAPGFVWKKVLPRLRSALAERFSFERSAFGATVSASEAIRVLQRVAGVESIRLETFRSRCSRRAKPTKDQDKEPKIQPRVRSALAYWNSHSKKVLAAQLVWLKSSELRSMPEQDR